MSDKHKDALDLDKLEAEAKDCLKEFTYVLAEPDKQLELIAIARRASQVSAAAPADSIENSEKFKELLYQYSVAFAEEAVADKSYFASNAKRKELIDFIDNFRASEGQAHPDDIAVDMFACAMKAKMAAWRYRARKYGGEWTATTSKLMIERMQEHDAEFWEIQPLAAQLADSTGAKRETSELQRTTGWVKS